MSDYIVKLNFNDGTYSYDFPYVYGISDPKESSKFVLIDGNRGDGSIFIPGGKKSQTITVQGNLFDTDGYVDLTAKMNIMRTQVTTNQAVLTLKHWDTTLSGGGGYVNDWAYTVRRTSEITFEESLRIGIQQYQIEFTVLAYS